MSRDTILRSKLQNCVIIPRNGFITLNASDKEDYVLFSQSEKDDGAFYVNLDAYAIIPLETFLPENKKIIATLRNRAKIWAKERAKA